MDDYSVPRFALVTGDYHPFFVSKFPRPLGFTIVFNKGSLLFRHDWLNHLISALTHALVIWLLYLALRMFSQSRRLCAALSILYLTCPLSYELIFWTSAMHAALSTAVFLLLLITFRQYADAGRRTAWLLLIVFEFALILSLYEQPASSIAVFPLLYLAFAPTTESWSDRTKGILAPCIVCGVLCVLYILGIRYHGAPGMRGGPGTFITLGEIIGRCAAVIDSGRYVLGQRMSDLLHGSFLEGARLLASRRGALWALALLGAFTLWLMNWCGDDSFRHRASPPRSGVRGWAILSGFTIFVFGWAPIIAIRNQTVEVRLFYYPLIGLIIALAVIGDWLITSIRLRPAPRQFLVTLLGVLVAFTASIQAVCLVGVQFAFRERARLDQAQVRQLQALVPDPRPGSVFVPLHTEDAAASTGFFHFDQFAVSAFATSWSAPRVVQYAYKRLDISSTYFPPPWAAPGLVFGPIGARCREPLRPFDSAPPDRTFIPYDRMIPFLVDARGNVTLVNKLLVEGANGEDTPVQFDTGLQKGTSYTMPYNENAATGEVVTGWRWLKSGAAVIVEQAREWSSTYASLSMHPAYPGDPEHGDMVATLRADPRPSRLVFRATIGEWNLNHARGDGVDLTWYLCDNPVPIASLRLLPDHIAQEKRWLPVVIDLPPMDKDCQLRCKASPGPRGNWDFDGCRVTTGRRSFDAAATQAMSAAAQ